MNDKKIKYIDLVFENCEGVKLEHDMYDFFEIDGIKQTISSWKDYITHIEYECEYFYIDINKKGSDVICGFGIEEYDKPLYERINNDITHVEICFDDDTKMYIAMPWDENGMYHEQYNDWQHNKKENGNIKIIISKDFLSEDSEEI